MPSLVSSMNTTPLLNPVTRAGVIRKSPPARALPYAGLSTAPSFSASTITRNTLRPSRPQRTFDRFIADSSLKIFCIGCGLPHQLIQVSSLRILKQREQANPRQHDQEQPRQPVVAVGQRHRLGEILNPRIRELVIIGGQCHRRAQQHPQDPAENLQQSSFHKFIITSSQLAGQVSENRPAAAPPSPI